MKKKITLREIASKAKVSAATASIVLNDKKNQGISDKTWKHVKKIAKKFNYSGNNKRRRLWPCRASGTRRRPAARDPRTRGRAAAARARSPPPGR